MTKGVVHTAPLTGVSLALSSGGVRGLAHVGALKALDRHQIPITAVAGVSMGGLIGALYCTGFTGEMIEEVVRVIRRNDWIDFSFSRMGMVRGRKLEDLIQMLTRGNHFEQCSPPLRVAAVDIERGVEEVLDSGPLVDAIRATVSVPGIFSPVEIGGKLLVDGGIINRVPTHLARRVPHSVVVAVDVGVELVSSVDSLFDVLFQTFDIMAREISHGKPCDADFTVTPDLPITRDTYFTNVDECIRAGEQAVEEVVPQLKEMLQGEERSWQNPISS